MIGLITSALTEDMAATVRFYTDLGFTLIYETKTVTSRSAS